MKYKITVSALTSDTEAGDVYETQYLQVLDLEENPAPDIARLLNPEPVYEEERDEEEDKNEIVRDFIDYATRKGSPETVSLPAEPPATSKHVGR